MSTRLDLRALVRSSTGLSLAGAAVLMAGAASAQPTAAQQTTTQRTTTTTTTVPALPPLSQSEVNSLPPQYRTGPTMADRTETTIGADGVETITRTRYITAQPVSYPAGYPGGPAVQQMAGQPMPMQPMPLGYAPQAVTLDRQQWIDECRRRTAGQSRNNTGTIIGALLGAIGGGVAGNLIAGAGDKLLGTVIGGAAGGLGGGLLGSLFNGRKRNRYDCETALDTYLSQGTPMRFASREIPYAPAFTAPAYAAPAYAYAPPVYGYGYPMMAQPGYAYAPATQNVLISTPYQQQQQVVVRETVREETVPGAVRSIPAPRPTKLIKVR